MYEEEGIVRRVFSALCAIGLAYAGVRILAYQFLIAPGWHGFGVAGGGFLLVGGLAWLHEETKDI